MATTNINSDMIPEDEMELLRLLDKAMMSKNSNVRNALRKLLVVASLCDEDPNSENSGILHDLLGKIYNLESTVAMLGAELRSLKSVSYDPRRDRYYPDSYFPSPSVPSVFNKDDVWLTTTTDSTGQKVPPSVMFNELSKNNP